MNRSTLSRRALPTRRHTLAIVAAASLWPTSFARAQSWPTRSITIVVPFPPGGAADGSARVLAEAMTKPLGQGIVVENRPGAGSVIGTQVVVQSNDGHTLLMGSTSLTILPALRSDLPYSVEADLQPVGMVSKQPLVLVVAPGSPLKTLDDLVARGKAGNDLTSGNSGNGSLSHLTTELFNFKMGTKLVPVPYKGESALLPDIVGGRTSMGFINLPSALPLLKTGTLRALAVTSAQPVAQLPGVRTLKSLGLDEFVIYGWAALYAAKDVPVAGVRLMSTLLQKALAEPSVRTRFVSFGVEPWTGTSAELREFTHQEIVRWGNVARARNIKLG